MNSSKSILGVVVLTAPALAFVVLGFLAAQKKKNEEARLRDERAAWIELEKEKDEEVLPSILDHFKELTLEYGCTVQEANKRRTTKYYQLARDAHVYDLVVAVRSYPRLRNLREEEMQRIMKYWNYHLENETKSHRTVIVMCDSPTTDILSQARRDILAPLDWSSDIATTGVWIPSESLIPESDMHVTVAIPWWWHTIQPGNKKLSEELAHRFRQAVVHQFHHPFQVELERIVLLGGKTLVALWRCVGERLTADGEIIYDRHGEGADPFVKLRRDIVRCFTGSEEFESIGNEPLTYSHRYPERWQSVAPTSPSRPVKPPVPSSKIQQFTNSRQEQMEGFPPPVPKISRNVRQNTIELKTPGLGDHDGFIHTTLGRLPLDCLSMKDVELSQIHRLCREATAQYCGHRMVVSKFRFLETTGAGGDSNPCIDAIFDETIAAPPRIEVSMDGEISENTTFTKNVYRHVSIGALPPKQERGSLEGLFSLVEQCDESQDV